MTSRHDMSGKAKAKAQEVSAADATARLIGVTLPLAAILLLLAGLASL